MRGFATDVEHIVTTILSQRRNDLLDSFTVCMKMTMDTLVTSSNLLRMKSDFTFDLSVKV